ncbi:hypothetical protein [Delftia acidovorans]|uniref:hypothetical protein n=1 Tax=Delftia acidovorans TaxID=80866 RepID=UPI002FDD65C6
MFAVKLIEVGDALGLTFPEELLRRLKLGEGDRFYMRESANGSVTFFAYDPDDHLPGGTGTSSSGDANA